MRTVSTERIVLLVVLVQSTSALQVLYPKHPLYPKEADDPYQPEYLKVREQEGIACSLFNFDALVDKGKFKARPAIEPGETVLYRGWMMTPAKYQQLITHLENLGARPITSVKDYTRCHHLPGWYEACADLTAESHFLDPDDDVQAAAAVLGWDIFFVKDFVKSNTGDKGSIASSPSEISEILDQLKYYRGDIEGGIALRKVENYIQDSEQRYIVVNKKAYGPDGNVPPIVEEVAERITAPFYSVDIIQTIEGDLRVVELGDGQVSDKKDWKVDKFVEVLLKMVEN